MKNLFFALMVMILGCDFAAMRQENAIAISSELIYLKDYRTNLCYASWGAMNESGVLTNVPCTPEVERLLVDR
jgi:hypothetical protein